ncbi:hypothetical protein [Streptomyces sp. SYSU K217416]
MLKNLDDGGPAQERWREPAMTAEAVKALEGLDEAAPVEEVARRLRRLRSAPSGVTAEHHTEAGRDAVMALVTVLRTLGGAKKALDRSVDAHLGQHPDGRIFASLPRAGRVNAVGASISSRASPPSPGPWHARSAGRPAWTPRRSRRRGWRTRPVRQEIGGGPVHTDLVRGDQRAEQQRIMADAVDRLPVLGSVGIQRQVDSRQLGRRQP